MTIGETLYAKDHYLVVYRSQDEMLRLMQY